MNKIRLFVLLITVSLLLVETLCAQSYSDLWGKTGEKWREDGRLPDFSYAGYHFGEESLPVVKLTANVIDFGAKGDGKTDCTEAFRKAIEATDKGAIFIPPGRYVLSDIIWIKKSGIVLRGAGREKTVLYFTKELEDLRPNMGHTTSGRPTSNYSWSGGFLWVKGSYREKQVAVVVAPLSRGGRSLVLDKVVNLKKGNLVMVEQHDDKQKSLLSHLYSGDAGDTRKVIKPIRVRMMSRIESVDGKNVVLERPLRFDLRKQWRPVLKIVRPTVSEVGIEDLAIEFPSKPYLGHFTERGMNAIAMDRVLHSWVKNVRISNSDSGIYLRASFCNIEDLVIDAQRQEHKGTTGHHGLYLGQDNLAMRFDFRTHFIHDLGFGYLSSGNVYKNGKGINLSFDHHKKAPYENLFSNIDVGEGGDIWRCGGGRDLGKHCGARGTFWNIKSKQNLHWPPEKFGPDSMNLIGLSSKDKAIKETSGKWFEPLDPERLLPRDLHAAQLSRRLKSAGK